MGEVWKARDTRLNRIVAIKQWTAAQPDRFQHEARAIAALNHPHICQIYDLGRDYLVLEYVEGTALQGPMPASRAIRFGVQIARALSAAHARGIIHLDLKPGNIIVTPEGGVKLLDFGIARLLATDADATRTAERATAGTLAYMSPEQIDGRDLDARSDIFSFGVVMYEMLAGTRPFGGQTTSAVLAAVLHDEPPPLNVPEELGRVVRRCLAKRPHERFQSMADVQAALEPLAEDPRREAFPAGGPSIVVLPFANLSPDRENEYFSDGLSEEIITALTHVPDLKVIARTSAFAFKGKNEDTRRIADVLRVSHVLDGSVRKAANRVRVTAQLINAADGSTLWSERYDRELEDVFAIQDGIASAVADALQLRLAPQMAARRRPTPVVAAYEALLKARYYWARFTPDALARSGQYLEEAIRLDPSFATAHCELGHHFFSRWAMTLASAHDAAPLVRQHAQNALAIDPGLQEAHALLGNMAVVYDYDWAEAERRFRLAMAQTPAPAQVRMWRAFFYLQHLEQPDRVKEAIEDQERALRENPLDVVTRWVVGCCLQSAGRTAEADGQFREVLELDRGLFASMSALCLSANRAQDGALDEAVALAQNAYDLTPWYRPAQGQLGGLLMRTGVVSRARELLDVLETGETSMAPFGFVLFHLQAGDMEAAAGWLDKAIDERDIWVVAFVRGRRLGGPLIRSSSRWPALARRLNIPAY
jgi:serine/threonine-protein kinase